MHHSWQRPGTCSVPRPAASGSSLPDPIAQSSHPPHLPCALFPSGLITTPTRLPLPAYKWMPVCQQPASAFPHSCCPYTASTQHHTTPHHSCHCSAAGPPLPQVARGFHRPHLPAQCGSVQTPPRMTLPAVVQPTHPLSFFFPISLDAAVPLLVCPVCPRRQPAGSLQPARLRCRAVRCISACLAQGPCL